jgi:glycine/D-amino acid oxidase-like deaminating enzyme
MTDVVVIGCGVVGAAIAYELSQVKGLQVTVLDRQPPAQAATGASLGVLMGVISQKTKGKAWKLRHTSMQRYETLIPELEAATGKTIPYNRQGILKLCFDEQELDQWRSLIDLRHSQGWQLARWDASQVRSRCPQIETPRLVAGIYSPCDRQLDPTALTLALVDAAQQNGVTFQFDAQVKPLLDPRLLEEARDRNPNQKLQAIQVEDSTQPSSPAALIPVDWVVVAAGLGSTALTQAAPHPLDIRPVLGQAISLQLDQPLGDANFQPMITGEDIHIVPIGDRRYWVGATVEFPTESGDVCAHPDALETVWQGAIAICPALASAKILKTWSGLRPRPHNRPAPIIEPLAGYTNVLLATGHYRNGVLLAPATAIAIRAMIPTA